MRFLNLELIGYIGIFNGLGLERISIDFSKSKYLICLIAGPNGVGKSTIINAAHVLPDANSSFVPGKDAAKNITLQHEDIIYRISIVSKWTNNKRTNEAYISKNGVELNPNGNISSYKDTIFSEFDIDPNYIAMTKISSEDRGIADKTPAERKKIIASRIASLDVYNEMYKVLNKKANIFKSHLNSISAKLQNIGNRDKLELRLGEISKSEFSLVEEIEALKKSITAAEVQIKLLDPDNNIFDAYTKAVKELEAFEKEFVKKENEYEALKQKLKAPAYHGKPIYRYKETTQEKQSDLNECEKRIATFEGEITGSIASLDMITRQIDSLQVRLEQASKSDDIIDDTKVQTMLAALEQKDKDLRAIVANMEAEGNVFFAKLSDKDLPEIEQMLKLITIIQERYSSLKNSDEFNNLTCVGILRGYITIQDSWDWVFHSVAKDISETTKEIEETNQEFSAIDKKIDAEYAELSRINNNIGKVDSLHKCSNYDCYYYKEHQGYLMKQDELKESIDNHLKEVRKQFEIIESLNNKLEEFNSVKELLDYMKSLKDIVIVADPAIKRIFDIKIGDSPGYYLENIAVFDQIVTAKSELESAYNNIADATRLSTAIATINSALERNKSYYAIDEQLSSLKNEREDINQKICTLNSNLEVERQLLAELKKDLFTLESTDKCREELDLMAVKVKELQESVKESQKAGEQITEFANTMSISQEAIGKAMMRLKEISDEKKHIESQLTIWDNFQQEYNEYKEKFDYVNILRKYCSPTQGGIQSIYMSIYMSKTLDLSNQLLSMLFDGQYRILDYIINEQEFRIPFIGGGLVVDDISSGSTSQKATMGSIISLVTASSSSSIYRIASLDETDSGLDQSNRMIYTDFILKVADILKLQQLLTISHSIESTLTNVDVILLSDQPDYISRFTNANVIYQYERSME